MNPLEFGIWSVLGILGYVTAHTVIERLLFHIGCRIARRRSLEQFCGQLRDFRSLEFTKPLVAGWTGGHRSLLRPEPLGWLRRLVVEANGSRSKLRQLLHDFEPIPNRFTSFQATMVTVGASLGLLGTVLAFVQVTGDQNLLDLLPLAFQTTLAGLLISIPASLVYGLLTPRTDQILDQIDLVMDALDDSEQREVVSPLEEVTDIVRVELAEVAGLLRSVAKSQESLVTQQQTLVSAMQTLAFADGQVNKTKPAALVRAAAPVNGNRRRVNGHAQKLSEGETNETR